MTVSTAAAFDAICRRATAGRATADARWAVVAPSAGPISQWTRALSEAGRLTVNFHPDRVSRSGLSVAAGLAADGNYVSQWVSGVTAGSRSAMTGGDRHSFERTFFEDAYESPDTPAAQYPIYGALDLLLDAHGGAPRFGSCFLVLKPHVRSRTTICLGDSHLAPRDVGTFADPANVLAGLAEQAMSGKLLNRQLDTAALLEILSTTYRPQGADRDLDGYVEIQVHGGLSLLDDVERIVLDPSFRGTHVEQELRDAANRYSLELDWHGGSTLEVDQVPDDFRGPSMRPLATSVAGATGVVDANAIGRAAARVPFGEPTPAGDPHAAPLQQLKHLWHTLLAHGCDAPTPK